MSIGSLGGLPPSTLRFTPAAKSPAESPSRARAQEDSPRSPAAAEAETRAIREQIETAKREANELRDEREQTLSHLQNDYDTQIATESSRSETAIESQKLRGYQAVRELKHNQEQDLNRVKREGERDIANLGNYYRDTVYNTATRGAQQLTEEERKQMRMMETLKRDETAENALVTAQHKAQVEALTATKGEQLQKYSTQTKAQVDKARADSETTIQTAKDMYDQRYKDTLAVRGGEIMDLETEASRQMKEVRQGTAQKISAYGMRQNDPFYKMVEFDAQLSDEGEVFRLRVKLPEHEQRNVAVSVRGNQLVLSGNRKNEERLDLGAGVTKSSGSYQSFNQTFPLPWPVDARGLSRLSEGDTLTITIPKKPGGPAPERRPAADTPRARLERPRFPENLPLAKADNPDENPSGDPSGTGRPTRRGGGRPLLG